MSLPRPFRPRASSFSTFNTLSALQQPRIQRSDDDAVGYSTLETYTRDYAIVVSKSRLNRFYADRKVLAPIAQKFKPNSYDTPMIVFDLMVGFSGLALYIIGSSDRKETVEILGLKVPLYVLGAAYSNFFQNILYAHCFAKATRNFKDENKALLAWSVVWGIITAYPPTAGMLRLSFQKEYSFFVTTELTFMTFVATVPLSFFAMYESAKRYLNSLTDNPRVRAFLNEQLAAVDRIRENPHLSNLLVVHSNESVKKAGHYLGMILGVSQALSLIGWVCDGEKFLEEDESFNVALSWVLSAGLFNFPGIVIAMLFSGYDFGELIVNTAYMSTLLLSGHAKYNASFREGLFDTALAAVGIITFWAALYSTQVSVGMYDHDCPRFSASSGFTLLMFSLLNWILRTNVDLGTAQGNGVLNMIAIVRMFNYVKIAYAPVDSEEYERNEVRALRNMITDESSEKLEEIAQAYFPDDKDRWENTIPAISTSRLSFLAQNSQNQHDGESIPLLSVENRTGNDGTVPAKPF